MTQPIDIDVAPAEAEASAETTLRRVAQLVASEIVREEHATGLEDIILSGGWDYLLEALPPAELPERDAFVRKVRVAVQVLTEHRKALSERLKNARGKALGQIKGRASIDDLMGHRIVSMTEHQSGRALVRHRRRNVYRRRGSVAKEPPPKQETPYEERWLSVYGSKSQKLGMVLEVKNGSKRYFVVPDSAPLPPKRRQKPEVVPKAVKFRDAA